MPSPLRLLVSVRNAQEAEIAAISGVEVIDFKEPERGSLGMVSEDELHSAISVLKKNFSNCFLSVACGEVVERESVSICQLPPVHYFKVGLAGLAGRGDWKDRWNEIRKKLTGGIGPQPECIAVAYVDAVRAKSPAIEEVIAAAIETGCAGVLFDTYEKSNGKLLDFISTTELRLQSQKLRRAGLLVTLAGKVGVGDLPVLKAVGADLIAVRSAVCEEENREAAISKAALQEFRNRMAQPPEMSGGELYSRIAGQSDPVSSPVSSRQ